MSRMLMLASFVLAAETLLAQGVPLVGQGCGAGGCGGSTISSFTQYHSVSAQYNPADFNLRPGEILVSVDGVPVNGGVRHSASMQPGVVQAGATMNSTRGTCSQCSGMPSSYRSGAYQSGAYQSGSVQSRQGQLYMGASNGNLKPLEVNRDPSAYAHALREASILASRGEGYHRHGDGGHPLGVAPGCRYSGTGYSRDPNRPNHCYLGEMSESRLVARAMVPGPNGTYFWSAHYR